MVRLIVLAMMLLGCASGQETGVRARLAAHPMAKAEGGAAPHVDGTLGSYVAHAVDRHPEMRAAYHRWEAATARIDAQRRLPDPMVSYTAFIQRVETRVGPQRHRLGLRQDLPWPTVLSHGASASSLDAESAGKRVDATALTLTARVSDAWWELWRIDRSRRVLDDEAQLLEGLAEAARARLEVGSASLSDVGQVALMQSRNAEARTALEQAEARAAAQLGAALGAHPGKRPAIGDAEPEVALPQASPAALRDAAADHPAVEALALAAASRREKADQAFAEGLPMLSLGFDWIEVGEAEMPNVPDSGKDALSVTVGLSVPLWRWAESAGERSARAEARALEAEREALVLARAAEVDVQLSRIADAARRVQLARDTLLPQAEAVIESTLADYQVGNAALASVILAERALLEIQLDRYEAAASHQQAWALLEHLVGAKVPAGEGL